MTLTDATPQEGRLEAAVEAAPGEPTAQVRPSGLAGLVGTADHKVVGQAYLMVSLLLLAASLVLAALLGFEGADLEGYSLLDGDTYFQIFTLSQLGIVLLGILPAFLGLAIYVVPLQVGASERGLPPGGGGVVLGLADGRLPLRGRLRHQRRPGRRRSRRRAVVAGRHGHAADRVAHRCRSAWSPRWPPCERRA